MKFPIKKGKSNFHHRGMFVPKLRKPAAKGAHGGKRKLEAWELPDDPRAANLPKCRICGLPTSRKDSNGYPLCEFCAEDYKQAIGAYDRWRPKYKDPNDEE